MRSSVRPNTDKGSATCSVGEFVSSELTHKTLSVFRVPVKVLAVGNHAASQVGYREGLFLIVPLVPLRDRLDVGSHGLVNAINA